MTTLEIERKRASRRRSRRIRRERMRILDEQWEKIENALDSDGFMNCAGYTRSEKILPFSDPFNTANKNAGKWHENS